jgi:polyisoprenoid-binding protein YceI
MSSLAAAPQSVLTTGSIDPAHSTVEFGVKHMMISTVRGRFADFHATVVTDAVAPAQTRIEAAINVASIDTRESSRDTHLKSADFFDAGNYPSLRFVSKRIEGSLEGKFKVVGDLTIRDTTREVVLDVKYEGEGKDPYGNDKRAFVATTRIDRRDYGLLWNVALETGGLLVSNDVRITIEAQFKREA